MRHQHYAAGFTPTVAPTAVAACGCHRHGAVIRLPDDDIQQAFGNENDFLNVASDEFLDTAIGHGRRHRRLLGDISRHAQLPAQLPVHLHHQIHFIVNTTEGKQAIRESHSIRREAVQRRVTYYTTLAAAFATCEALDSLDEVGVNRLQDLHLQRS